jgi:hypothetical protein
MKKTLIALALVGLFAAAPALANNGNGNDNNRGRGGVFYRADRPKDDSRFVVTGTVNVVNASSVEINATQNKGGFFGWFHWGKNKSNNSGLTGAVTINTNSDTKITQDKDTIALNQIAKNDIIVVTGTKTDDDTLLASAIRIQTRGAIAGQVTAKTDNSVTIKNNVTGETKTVATDDDSKISINGEEKAVADIEVGDRGFVKFKKTVDGLVAKFIGLFR